MHKKVTVLFQRQVELQVCRLQLQEMVAERAESQVILVVRISDT